MTDSNSYPVSTLFLDIGGVLLTNGWGHESRFLAVDKFGLDKSEMESRHQTTFDTYEIDKMTFDEYLDNTVFYESRNFSKDDFKNFIFEQSKPLDGHIDYFKSLKEQYGLKVIAVSNEGREINEYRINKFKLDSLFDAYISSCYVHLHKPDKEILKLASDISHTKPENGLYIDDRLILIEVAKSFGFQTHHFQNLEETKNFMSACYFRSVVNNKKNVVNAV